MPRLVQADPFQRAAAAVRAQLARKVHVLVAAAAALDQEAAGIQLELVEGLYALGFSHICSLDACHAGLDPASMVVCAPRWIAGQARNDSRLLQIGSQLKTSPERSRS